MSAPCFHGGQVKTCTKCGEEKPLGEFHKNTRSRDGLQGYCKACNRAVVRERRKRKPEAYRATELKRNHKLSVAQYDALMASQGGKCAICRTETCPSGKSFAVDHDHSCCSGRRSCGNCIRGLLCMNCNNALGKFKDSEENLITAIRYLKGSRSAYVLP